jgi:thiol-disulfide isomerase/thioredoxin
MECMKRALFLIILLAIPGIAHAQYLPPFIYFDLEKGSHQLEYKKGRITFLHFWATWCVPCVRELPKLNQFAKMYQNSDKIQVIAVSLDSDPAVVSTFFKRHKIDALTPYIDLNNNAMRLLVIGGLPTTLIVNDEEKEIDRLMGDYDWPTFNFETFKVARLPRD